MTANNIFTIRSVAQSTGLKPHLIRTWERRYRAVEPQRTPTNRRVYAESDIEKLLLLKQAVGRGHSISRIARMRRSELAELLKAAPAGPKPSTGTKADDYGADTSENYQQQALLAAADLDAAKLEEVLAHAAVHLSRSDFIYRFVVPLFATMGERWAAGQLRISCEHMATVVVRSFLWDMLRDAELSDSAPKIVLATPVGQWHELGLMAVAVEAAECGWRPVYLGPDLPAEEIAYAVDRTGSRAIALYIAHSLDAGRLPRELTKLHNYLEKGVALFVGGGGCLALKTILEQIEALHIENAAQFREHLRQLTLKR